MMMGIGNFNDIKSWKGDLGPASDMEGLDLVQIESFFASLKREKCSAAINQQGKRNSPLDIYE